MSFKELLEKQLENKLTEEEKAILPKGFQKVGEIIILNLNEKLYSKKKEIGEATMRIFPKVKTVCNKIGGITGDLREPQNEIIAGDENTEVIHLENGCRYKFDLRKVMFAKGNVSERVRVAKQIKPTEIIVDMFAGIGYFTVPNAKLGKPKKIYAIELNPTSCKYLKENIKLNKIEKIVEIINGDSKKEVPILVEKYGRIADRVMMGYLPPPKDFLPHAMMIIKKGGILHYEDLVGTDREQEDIDRVMKDVKNAAKEEGFKAELLLAKKIKGYGPKIDHYVFDILIE